MDYLLNSAFFYYAVLACPCARKRELRLKIGCISPGRMFHIPNIFSKNLITIGTSANLMWENGNLFFYYPAHSPAEAPGEDRLQLSIKDNNNTVTRLRPYDLAGSLSIKLSKNLLLVNGAELDYSKVVSGSSSTNASNAVTRSNDTNKFITDQSTVRVGSVEGSHRSRATYKYVRVIRKEPFEP